MDSIDDPPLLRVEARVQVLRTEEGGRKGPFTHDYRPNHNFGEAEGRSFYIGRVELPEGTWIYPGETREIMISFFNVRGLSDILSVGRTWRIQEGPRLIATAEVLSVRPWK